MNNNFAKLEIKVYCTYLCTVIVLYTATIDLHSALLADVRQRCVHGVEELYRHADVEGALLLRFTGEDQRLVASLPVVSQEGLLPHLQGELLDSVAGAREVCLCAR